MWEDPRKNSPIPWSRPTDWQAAQLAIHHHIAGLAGIREFLLPFARRLEARFGAVAFQMEALCAHTCTCCPDPCCSKASVWYDFRDLLGLHLYGKSIPMGQPISDYGNACRYISHSGCMLPRSIRPWICTWYLCPVQKRWLQRQPGDCRRSLELALDRIKTERALLEDKFIAATCRWVLCEN